MSDVSDTERTLAGLSPVDSAHRSPLSLVTCCAAGAGGVQPYSQNCKLPGGEWSPLHSHGDHLRPVDRPWPDLYPHSPVTCSFSNGIECDKSCERTEPCFPIPVTVSAALARDLKLNWHVTTTAALPTDSQERSSLCSAAGTQPAGASFGQPQPSLEWRGTPPGGPKDHGRVLSGWKWPLVHVAIAILVRHHITHLTTAQGGRVGDPCLPAWFLPSSRGFAKETGTVYETNCLVCWSGVICALIYSQLPDLNPFQTVVGEPGGLYRGSEGLPEGNITGPHHLWQH